MAALILFLGVTAAVEMPTDIFPEIAIPVVSVIWQYTGLNTTEMEQRFTTYSQYAIRLQRQRDQGHRSRDRRHLGTEDLFPARCEPQSGDLADRRRHERDPCLAADRPPIVVQYSASAVPVLQISLSSDYLNESQLYDYGIYRLRQMIAPIHGVTLPPALIVPASAIIN